MFYVMDKENLVLFDDNLTQLETTRGFMPQLTEETRETDIVTAEELRQYPNKVIVGDIEIEVEVPEYETQTEEHEEIIYETELIEEEYQEHIIDEEGNFVYEEHIENVLDENGEPLTDENGDIITNIISTPVYETKTKLVEKPIMIDVEEVILVPVYDNEGNFVEEKEEIVITQKQKTHIEIKSIEKTIQVGSHKETIITKGLILNPNFEAEQTKKEKERIGKLECTKRVFILMLEQLGVSYFDQIKPLIESNSQAQLEWELCVKLERSNPLLDIMAGQLGVTSEQLDGLFKYANGEIAIEEFKNTIQNKEELD